MNGRKSKWLRKQAQRIANAAPGYVVAGTFNKFWPTGKLREDGSPEVKQFQVVTARNTPGSFRSVLTQLKKYVRAKRHGYVKPLPPFNDGSRVGTSATT